MRKRYPHKPNPFNLLTEISDTEQTTSVKVQGKEDEVIIDKVW